MLEKVLGLLVALGISFTCAALGSILTAPQIGGWYAQLIKPPWNPPAWLFGPVWTCLFALMAVSAWLVWLKSGDHDVRVALSAFAVQLVFNVAWSALFFAAHSPRAALVEIGVLIIAIAATILAFARVDLVAATLLLPYVLWVSFAAYLNYTIVRLNA